MGRCLGERKNFLLVSYMHEFYDKSDSTKSSVDGLIYRKTFSEARHMFDSLIIYLYVYLGPFVGNTSYPLLFIGNTAGTWLLWLPQVDSPDVRADPVTPLFGCVLHDEVRLLSPTS